jgi:phosphate-selective porin OprO/OprP
VRAWWAIFAGLILCSEAAGQDTWWDHIDRPVLYAPDARRPLAAPEDPTPSTDPAAPAKEPSTGKKAKKPASTPPKFRLRGRIDADSLFTDQSPADRATFGDLGDRVGLRRARIGAEGNLSPDSRYVVEFDFASGQFVLRDGYYAQGLVQDQGESRFGHMREPFSLEGGTSANSFAFMERSPVNVLDPARNWGAAFTRGDETERWTWSAGVFASGTDPSDVQFGPGSTTDLTSRWTFLPQDEDDGQHLMHLGAAFASRIADQGVINVAQRPRSPLLAFGDSTDSPFVSKLSFAADYEQLINLQWATVQGPFWAQAEWYGAIICQRSNADVFLHGSHVDCGYFLTGEHRSYLRQGGVFGPVSVRRPFVRHFSSKSDPAELGYGAWELTARMTYLDFLDHTAPLDVNGLPAGVILPQATFGANWYLADRLRLMFNYSYAVPYTASTGHSSVSVFGLRIGVFW